jgi:hypothetical protein
MTNFFHQPRKKTCKKKKMDFNQGPLWGVNDILADCAAELGVRNSRAPENHSQSSQDSKEIYIINSADGTAERRRLRNMKAQQKHRALKRFETERLRARCDGADRDLELIRHENQMLRLRNEALVKEVRILKHTKEVQPPAERGAQGSAPVPSITDQVVMFQGTLSHDEADHFSF